ncbi:spore coat protein [Bacillus thermotolerans]|uniref:spore coat protein n=1 Tax=Bacillus thermotolerans TaxID=1221996 RepID=UPI000C01F60F|nr:spore coat protein [Bacillus thermotolerans]
MYYQDSPFETEQLLEHEELNQGTMMDERQQPPHYYPFPYSRPRRPRRPRYHSPYYPYPYYPAPYYPGPRYGWQYQQRPWQQWEDWED